MLTWTKNAAACPAIQVPGSLLDPAGADASTVTSLVAEGILAGTDGLTGLDAVNRNAVRLDNAARYGGARAHAVLEGLDLSGPGGLTVSCSAGAAVVGAAHVIVPAALTAALTNNADNWVWLLRTGLLSVQPGTLAAPGSPAVLLGLVVTAAGAVTGVDYSGRLELRGGTLYRRTADAGAPADTPPAGLILVQRTAGGRYLWDGDAYGLLY